MHLPPRGPGEMRIGVALQIPAPYSAVLHGVRSRLGDPMAYAIPPHVTIVPPTVVPADSLDEVAAHLADVAAEQAPFVLRLRGTGTFRPVSPVVFVNVVEGGAECDRLQARARTGLLGQELRFPYHPHVTLAHEVDDARLDEAMEVMAGFEATYAVGSMRLYEHGDDGMWRTVVRVPLTGTRAGASVV